MTWDGLTTQASEAMGELVTDTADEFTRGDWAGLSPPYATIVADPPWPYEDQPTGWQRQSRREAFLPYSRMTLTQIAGMNVEALAAPGAHLYLWTTQRYLWAARDIADGWGWQVGPVLTWCKEPMGYAPGAAWAPTTEFVLACRRPVGDLIRKARHAAGLTIRDLSLAVRGTEPTGLIGMWEKGVRWPGGDDWTRLCQLLPTLAAAGQLVPAWVDRVPTSWFQAPRGSHSEKPAAFLDLVEQVSPAPRVELFARQPRLGWDSWGWGYEGATA